MTPKITLAALLVATAAGTAQAQQFTGGTLGVQTFVFTDDFSVGSTAYFGGAELALPYGISLGANGSYFGLTALDSDARSLTLHGSYDLGLFQTGLFYTLDSSDAEDSNIYGLEAAADLGGAQIEGFAGRVDGDLNSGGLFGVSGSYDITRDIAAQAKVGLADVGDTAYRRFSVGGTYALTDGLDLFADLGNTGYDTGTTDASSTFIGLGARIVFGPNRGTTFGSRSMNDLFPSF